ncbi:MAG: class I SAM-dependent methyltransferase [Rhodothermales bacterium]|nr:class I SAM-dependent methyltransferase [Rhodothermales bacterium]
MTKDVGDLSRSRVQDLQNIVYEDIQTRLMIRDVHLAIARNRLKLLSGLLDSGSLLEIGCATGEFLELAAQSGFETLGVDASDIYVDYARERGIPIFHGRLEDADLQKGSFDAVALFHLIEHIEDPAPFLTQLGDLLRPSGYIFIATPNLPASTHKLLGFRHPNFHQEDHLYFFSAQTLKALLLNCGFDEVTTHTLEHPHAVFTSLYGLMARSMKKTKNGSTTPSESGFRTSPLRRAMKRTPFLAATVLRPLLRTYGRRVEKRGLGHELIVLARRAQS